MAKQIMCPKCRSVDVSPNLSSHSVIIGTFQHEYRCNNCGYEGVFPLVEAKKSKKSKK